MLGIFSLDHELRTENTAVEKVFDLVALFADLTDMRNRVEQLLMTKAIDAVQRRGGATSTSPKGATCRCVLPQEHPTVGTLPSSNIPGSVLPLLVYDVEERIRKIEANVITSAALSRKNMKE